LQILIFRFSPQSSHSLSTYFSNAYGSKRPSIGLVQLGGCELHGGIMTENGDWLVGVRGCYWPLAVLRQVEIHG